MEYITNENNFKGKRIVLISSYCDTKEKIDVLINTIKTVKSHNLDVMVNSPLPLPSDVINMCDFYVQTKENPLLNWPEKSVMSWVKHTDKNKEIVIKRSVIDYGWAALYQTKKLSEYALTYDYERYYHIIYDTAIDDTVVSTFLSDKKSNFFPFHEHKVSLHLIALDRENLLKFSNLITFDSYLKFNCIVENWLYDTLIKSDMNYKIELEKIDDLILFHKDENLFDYSNINGLVFFIVKDVVNNDEVSLYFYNNKEKINVFITVDGVETSYDISNRDIINLGFKPYNIKNVLISYDGISSDITEKIKNITHNVIETKIIMNELTILANKYGSDKGTEYGDKHNFTETYEKYFKSFKHKSINILEIGINDGSSLKIWYDYFPNATIYGVDINDKSNFSNERVKCIVLDQSKKEDLEEFVKNINVSFDIIIDDGSHHISDQQRSFGSLFPLLKDDGIYVIEDLHTSLCEPNKMLYGRPMENNIDKTNTTLYYLQNKQYNSEYLSQDENKYIQNNIGSVKIYEKDNSHEWKKSITSIITKKLKIKLLYLTPHLSTGGMPQFVLKRIEELQKFKDQIEIFLVEYSQFSNTYVVQRDKIIDILGEGHFFSLGDTTDTKRKYELIDIIKNNNIDVVHSEEMVEGFESFNKIPLPLLNQLYSNDRTWKMVETCHNVWFNPQTHKKFNPEAYCFVTPYHLKEAFLNETPIKFLSLYPIENKVTKILEENEIYGDFNQVPLIEKIKVRNELGLDMFKTHVLNVGLWTSGKNQGEGVEVARELIESNPDIQFHFIGNQAPNFEDYWGPIMNNLPSNVKVWGERNDVEKFMTACDVLMFNSTWECNPLVVRESINYGMKILARDLPQYMGMFDGYITLIEGDVKNISKQLVGLIENKDVYKILPDDTFGEDLLNFYNAVTNINITQNKPLTKDYTFVRHYVTQPYFEVQGTTENKLNIKYYDDKNEISYQNELPINSWIKLNTEYFIKWRTTVEENGEIIYDETLNLKDKRVYISFGSKSLGDTMAWIPYCEVFRKKHGCKLIVSTFLNSLFKDQYRDIEFVEPGDLVPNIHAQYRLGWHYTSEGVYDNNKHPFDFKKMPLQKTATDILGLDYEEVRPLLKLPNTPKKKKVGIGFHSTAQAKYWNNPDGWQAVIDHLNNLGYECMIYSKEGDGYMGNNYPEGVTIFKGGNLQEVIDDLSECEFFIGLGSGLSWLAWACKLPVVLISGFSEKWAETTLDTYRVINEIVCHGCFNKERLDSGDWNWCPLHKNTTRMFECTKEISSDMVIKEINKIINKEVMEEKIDEVSFDWGGRSDWYVKQAEEEIFEGNTYERFFEVEEGDIVVDLGASLGPFTYKILPKNPKQCYVVEPISHQIEILKKNVGQENVKIIQGAITDKKKIEISWDDMTEIVPTFSFKEFLEEHKINKIDFLKCDCEGGEYDVFQESNIEFLKTIPKIVTEFHLNNDSNYHECKFRWFRDNIFPQFDNIQVFSVDGVDIKWDLWNEHFIEYYNEVIIYMDNRK